MKKLTLIILMVIMPIFYVGSNGSLLSGIKEYVKPTVDVEVVPEMELTEEVILSDDEIRKRKEDTIRHTMLGFGVTPFVTELIVAQSKLESGNYSNNLYKYNNVFGRHYGKMDTLALGAGARAEGHNKFAKYPSIQAATISQYQYLKRKNYTFKWKSARQYAIELKSKRYYECSINLYATNLKKLSRWDPNKQGLKD